MLALYANMRGVNLDSSTCVKFRGGSTPLQPQVFGRQRQVDPGTQWPASLSEALSYRFSERQCLKNKESNRGRGLLLTSGLHTCML